MSLRIMDDIVQGTDEWLEARRGIITASTVGQLITAKTLKPAVNDFSRALVAQIVAERITGWVEDTYPSLDMLRGEMDEPIARNLYSENFAPATEVGFMVRDDWGFPIGYSPDGLVSDDGLIEIKSRRPKKHLQTIISGDVPPENMAQLQAGLLVSGRSWCDYVSYCGGMPMWVKRVYPEPAWQNAIVTAAAAFEQEAARMIATYETATDGLPPTERTTEMEIVI